MNELGGRRLAHLLSPQSAEEDAPIEPAQICAAAPSPYGMPPSLNVRVTVADIDLLLDALARASARLESMARTAKYGRKHDITALRMRALRFRLMRQKMGNDG